MVFAKFCRVKTVCWAVGPRLSEMSSNPVDIQKVVQDLGRKSTVSLRAPISLSVRLYLQCPEWSQSSWPARCAPSCWGTSTCLGALRPGCFSPGSANSSGHSAAFWTRKSQSQGPSQRASSEKVCQHKRTWRPWGSGQRDGTAWWSGRSAASADGDTSSPAWGGAGRLHRRGLLWVQEWIEQRTTGNGIFYLVTKEKAIWCTKPGDMLVVPCHGLPAASLQGSSAWHPPEGVDVRPGVEVGSPQETHSSETLFSCGQTASGVTEWLNGGFSSTAFSIQTFR